jgi:hypothetical protein
MMEERSGMAQSQESVERREAVTGKPNAAR